ncbi:MAG: DUF87 domain-containing protein [Candidatus Saccharibacteria bacterium]|nr:DUF87 domain-containing protein [Candidatus Saccharibacteria bacterium]MCY4011032.1 DUF87 domain-containing protein [Candidatus Saccharibacteria bacterium]
MFKSKPKDPQALIEEKRLQEQQAVQAAYQQGVTSLLDFIAPPSLEFFSTYFRMGVSYVRSAYVFGYPREVYSGWLGQVISLPQIMDITLHIYPVQTATILKNLRRKTTQLEASITLDREKGRVRDPGKEAQLLDTEDMRDRLQMGEERFFRFGFYYTVYAQDLEGLEIDHKRIEALLNRQLIYSKPASAQQEEAFNSVAPLGLDQLMIRRNMNTGALGTTFPFTSANLTQDRGILYGINLHNSGLVIFDRFSLENSNSVVLSESGAGKSFAVKLEALRLMMLGVEVIIIDPENEYQRMAEAVGGTYINLSLSSPSRINPFDLPKVEHDDDDEDVLRNNLIDLHGLLRLMLGGMQTSAGIQVILNPTEEADLDVALIDTYAKAGITRDPLTHSSPPPILADLHDTLSHMGGSGPKLAQRLRKYMSGTFAGLFSQQSNVKIDNQLVVFNIRDLEDEIRPIGMYMVLNYIWNKTRSDKRKRILIVDEAWQIMKYEDSANFMFGLTKRARKYNLGITNITQDVEDFTSSRLGRSIIANSSMQLLLKQSSTAIDLLSEVFKLTQNEKKLLNQFPVGQGLFFAGRRHVEMQVLASPSEQDLITTSPDELLALQEQKSPQQSSQKS